ncbi:hypothetical protein [Limosilactobacillus caecicola]|uniref:hypothetical protein n=1 Tax=Limosilactobacillus caecicola TaxID=2941332 RepID=UPI00203B60CB|nr:hypothetical protein [Limosilactobacillus caecicola]
MFKQDFHQNYGVTTQQFIGSFAYIYKFAEEHQIAVTVRRKNIELGMFLTPSTFTKLQDLMEDLEDRHKRDMAELRELKKDNKSLELKVRLLQNNNNQQD